MMDMENLIKTQIKEALCEEFEKDVLFDIYYKWGEFGFRPNYDGTQLYQHGHIEVRHSPKLKNSNTRLSERTSFTIPIIKHRKFLFVFPLTPEQELDNKLYNHIHIHLQEKEKHEYLKKNKELLDMMPEDKRIKLMRELKLNRITK